MLSFKEIFIDILRGIKTYVVLFAVIVILSIIILTRRPELISWLIGIIASASLFPLIKLATRRAANKDVFIFLVMFGLSILLFILSVASQGLLALLNGYPSSITTIPVVWFLSASCGFTLYFLQVLTSYIVEKETYTTPKVVAKALGASALLSAVTVVFFSIYISLNARNVIGSPLCIMETDYASSRFNLWFSPRKMLFENNYKGSTSPYLRAGTDSKNMTHHWSFRAFSFIEDETAAFSSNLSFYKSSQRQRKC